MRKVFMDISRPFGNHGSISRAAFDTTRANGTLNKFSYFSICSNYFIFDTALEEEADVNEEGNEDCPAVL